MTDLIDQLTRLHKIALTLDFTDAARVIEEEIRDQKAEKALDEVLASPSAINTPWALCTHVDNRGMPCLRVSGHTERHKYKFSDEEAKQRAGEISRDRLAAARSNQEPLECMTVGRFKVCVGDAVSLAPSETNDHRGWLGVLKELYSKDGTDYAVVLGRKGSKHAQIKEKIIRAERIEYIRPNTEKARQAKIRAGRPV